MEELTAILTPFTAFTLHIKKGRSKFTKNKEIMKTKKRFSKLKLFKGFICLYVESVHRYVFDNQYLKSYVITKKDIPILWWYHQIFKIYPDFRSYLKHNKYIAKRAYNQRRLSLLNMFFYWNIRNKNVERYSSYDPIINLWQ